MRKKSTRINLSVNQADKQLLEHLTSYYSTSTQRIIEAALAQMMLVERPQENIPQPYTKDHLVPLRADGLMSTQLATLITKTGMTQQDILRIALQRFGKAFDSA